MSVERGFSVTDWLLPKRRQRMSHTLYSDIKLVISQFQKENFEEIIITEWDLIKPHIQLAASMYTTMSKEKKVENEKRKRKQEEIRETLNIPAPRHIRKKLRKNDIGEEKIMLEKLAEIQRRRENDYMDLK